MMKSHAIVHQMSKIIEKKIFKKKITTYEKMILKKEKAIYKH